MWAVASCPKCGKQVAVPMAANASSLMRCPLCRAEYPLEEALNNLPPELEIVTSTQPAGEASEMPFDAGDLPHDLPFIPPEPARPLQRERSTMRLMLEVVIGGLLAGPIALLIIMWGFGRDPLHMAGKLPRFMVPPSMRADADDRGPVIIDAN